MLQIKWRKLEESVTLNIVDLVQNLCFGHRTRTGWKMGLLCIYEALHKITLTKTWKLCQFSKVLFSCLTFPMALLQRLVNYLSASARSDIKYRQLWVWHSCDNHHFFCQGYNCQAGTLFSLDLDLMRKELSFDALSYSVLPHYLRDSKNVQMNQVLEIQ